MSITTPAILGGEPTFEPSLPFARPTIEPDARDEALKLMDGVLESGMLTNGPLVRRLEDEAAAHFGVEHCVAVASCTTGLMLVLQALGKRRAVLPSFTFAATGHAARWNAMDLAFADCDRESFNITPETAAAALGDNPDSVIMGVHISGVPCDVTGLEALAAATGAELMFDAAHGAGTLVAIDGEKRRLGGFGRAEVFSLTPTKVMSSAEGGLVATNDAELAARIKLARDYGNPGDYDMRFAGLNARMSELHASLALVSLSHLESRVANRNAIATEYLRLLGEIPGIAFQQVGADDRSSYKDFTIVVGDEFGASRDAVVAALHAEGVPTRPYYAPPVHRQTAYRDVVTPDLPVTDALAGGVISLPIFSHLELADVAKVAAAVAKIHAAASDVAAAAGPDTR